MKILNIHITEFGALENRDFTFSESLNIINGANESGKSTLMLFIRFILFGLPKRSRTDTVSDADRALSWKNGLAAGSMTVLCKGKKYRIERQCRISLSGSSKSIKDEMQIIDCETGSALKKGETPEKLFLEGVPYEVFESSCFIGQMRCTSINGDEVGSTIENILSSADENIDVAKVLKKLESSRVTYLHKNQKGGSLYELEAEINDLKHRIDKAYTDKEKIDRIAERTDRYSTELKSYGAERNLLSEKLRALRDVMLLRQYKKLHSDEKQLEDLRAQKKELEKSLGGFIPDENYLTSLRIFQNSLREQEKRVESATNEYISALNRPDTEDNSLIAGARRIDEDGGKEAIMLKVQKLFRKAKSYRSTALIFILLSLIFASGGILMLGKIITAGILFGICAVCAVSSALMFISSIRNKKELDGICDSYGTDYGKLPDYLTSCSDAMKRLKESEYALKEKNQALDREKKLLDDKRKEIISMLDPVCSDDIEDISILENKLAELISQIDEFCKDRKSLQASISSLEDTVSEILKELNATGKSEDEIRLSVPEGLENISESDIKKALDSKKFLDAKIDAINKSLIKDSTEKASLDAVNENPLRLSENLEAKEKEYAAQKAKYNALMLAISSIETASESLRNNITPRIRGLANDSIGKISGNKYTSLGITHELSLSVDAGGFTRPVDALSSGTRDAAYISLRLAILRLLFSVALPPLMMDETFAQLDDKRSSALLDLLTDYCSDGGQCLIFTCHNNEHELADSLGIEHSLIRL